MRKCIFVLILINELLSSTAFAYISGKKLKNEPTITCPFSFVCGSPNMPPGECRVVISGEDAENYSKYWMPVSKGQADGTYNVVIVKASYHSSSLLGGTCEYKNKSPGHSGGFTLQPKPESNLEAFTSGNTYWVISGENGVCKPPSYAPDPGLCPLKIKSAVMLHNIDITGGISASINGTRISITPDSGYMNVTFDEAMIGCSSVKICKIDITSSRGALLGSISVDMDNKMKITEITSVRPSWVIINKVEPFNTAEVKYSNQNRPR